MSHSHEILGKRQPYTQACSMQLETWWSMDADLQDPPSMLLEMKALLDQNADLTVLGHGELVGRENLFPQFLSRPFTASCKISPVALPSGVRDFRMMRRSVVDAILTLTESNRFLKDSLPGWVLKRTILIIQTLNDRLARPVGVLDNSFLLD